MKKSLVRFVAFSMLFISINTLKANEWHSYTNTNFINYLIGDSNYLYCATRGGLTIFSFAESSFIASYTNVDGLNTNRLTCLLFDKFQNIWVGSYRGISIFNPITKKITNYNQFGELNQVIISCLNRCGDTILVGTKTGLYLIDTKGTVSTADDNLIIPNFPGSFTRNIFSVNVNNDFWVGASPGIIKLNRNLQSYTCFPHPFGDSVKAMIFVYDTLFILTEKGLAKYNDTTFVPIIYFPEDYLVFDLKYAENNFYIAATCGLIKYQYGGSMSFILNEDTRSIFINDEIWAGIGGSEYFGGGIKCLVNGNIKSYFSNGLKSNYVSCLMVDNEGSIYALHFTLEIWGNRTISYKKAFDDWQLLYDTLMNCNVGAIDSKNRIWLGHWFRDGGISCYDFNTNSWYVQTWTGPRGVIAAIGIDKHDTKWIYTESGTISAIDSTNQTIEFNIPGLGLLHDRHGRGYEFAFDIKNRVWLASQDGLVMIDYNNTLFDQSDDTYRIFRQGLSEADINSVAIDAENQIWCATVDGPAILKNDTFKIMAIDADKVTRIKTDNWGGVWILTNKGLFYYNIYTKIWASYTAENSYLLPNIENDNKFYDWLSINQEKGYLLIGTKEGISQFDYRNPPLESLSEIKIYPNPFIAKEHQVITFDSLPFNASIKIYTIQGEFITEIKPNMLYNAVRWHPTSLRSGIYLALVITEKKIRIAKFAVIR
ncbi:MAG: T9SS type A sorting domain-containing protein [candidate division WOR-3 bacterium]